MENNLELVNKLARRSPLAFKEGEPTGAGLVDLGRKGWPCMRPLAYSLISHNEKAPLQPSLRQAVKGLAYEAFKGLASSMRPTEA